MTSLGSILDFRAYISSITSNSICLGDTTDAGTLVLGDPDPALYQGALQTTPIDSSLGYFQVTITNIGVSGVAAPSEIVERLAVGVSVLDTGRA